MAPNSRDERVRAHTALVCAVARGMARRLPVDYEDLRQVGMIGLLEAIDSYDGRVSIAMWVRYRVRCKILDFVRGPEYRESTRPGIVGEVEDQRCGPEQQARDGENLELLRVGLAGLTEQEREYAEARWWGEQSQEAAGRVVGIGSKASTGRFEARLLARLRRRWAA